MMVLSADGNGGMRTCVLRPSNLFGPGESSLVRLVAGYARSPLSKVFEAAISPFPFSFYRSKELIEI
jgi:nucleoside-diphosphate-sugar epimerase